MISVKRIYEVLKDLANKEQRGFVSPSEFNTMAPIAQTAVYNAMWAEAVGVQQLVSTGRDGQRAMSKERDVKEDLAAYLRSETLDRQSDFKFLFPDDYYKIASAKTYGDVLMNTVTSIPIELVYDVHKLDYMLQSPLSAPTATKPVAFVADKIELYPKSIRKIDLRYYKIPEGVTTAGVSSTSQPQYNFNTIGGDEVFDASTSINFELPEDREDMLVVELAGMIGTALRDAALVNYGRQK
jgi:hypothetical protein